MGVKRIVANLAGENLSKAKSFYQDLFQLEVLMDMGWVVTFGAEESMSVQLSIASEGGSGTPVPALSIEVDDLDRVLQRAQQLDIAIEYGPVTEPWGVERFYVKDPLGNLINVLQHAD